MNNLWTWFLLAVSLVAISERSTPTSPQESDVMLVAVSHDARMLGLGTEWNPKGTAFVEPLARVSSAGEWKSLPCFADRDGKKYAATQQEDCSEFGRAYLSKPHTYTVVSADGRGATVNAQPVELDECLSYTEKATYSGASIAMSAIGASSSDFVSDSPAPQLLSSTEAKPFLKAFSVAVPGGLDSTLHLSAFLLRLEGQQLTLVQRAYVEPPGTKLIFAFGKMDQDIFQILYWKENVGDEDEVVVGTVHLTNGRDFLITTVIDPEGQWFRVYGIRQRKLVMVYSGGGSSC